MGMPTASAAVSLAARPYSRVIADARILAPSLEDREATAKQLIDECEQGLLREKEKSRRARLHYEVARLTESSLGDLSAALKNYQKAHALDATFEPTIAGQIRVRSLLGQWEGTLPLFDEQIALTARPEDRAGLLFCKAVVAERRLGREAEARADYEKALALVPDDAALLSAVVRCAERDQDASALDHLHSRQAETAAHEPGLSAARLSERARKAEHLRKKPSEAAQFYAQAFQQDPLASPAALALERLLITTKNPADQAKLLTRRAALLRDPRLRSSTLAAAALVLADQLDEPAAGAKLMEEAWEADPSHVVLLREIEELYRRAGDFEGVVRVLMRREEQSTGAQKAELCLRIAEVFSRRLSRMADAATYFERARILQPASPSAVDPLIAYYESTEAWGRLVQVLADEEAASSDLSRRAEAHFHIARVCDRHLASKEDAIKHCRAALGLVPGHEAAFRDLSRLLTAARRYEEVVELHERAAEAAEGSATAFMHWFRAGSLLELLLDAPERAVICYKRVLEKDAAHPEALVLLQRAAFSSGDHDALVEALLREAETDVPVDKKLSLLLRAAQVSHENLGQQQRAQELLHQILALNPKYEPALSALFTLHEGAGRHVELLKVMQLKLSALVKAEDKEQLYLRMGRLAEEHLSDDEKALGFFKKALEFGSDFPAAEEGVTRVLERRGRYPELAVFLAEVQKRLSPSPRRAEISLFLGRIYEVRLGKLPQALACYESALGDVPDLLVAQEACLRVLEQKPEARKTADALETYAGAVADGTVRLWSRLRRAELLESHGRSPEEAISAYQGILKEHPHHPQALTALERLYTKKGDEESLRQILGKQVEAFKDEAQRMGALRGLVALSESSTESETSATTDAERLLEHRPQDRPALRFSELSALGRKNVEDLAAVDAKLVELPEQRQLKAFHQTRLGEFLEARNPVQALKQYRGALSLDEENVGAARGLTRVAEVVDDPTLLMEAAELEAKIVQSPKRAAQLLTRAGTLLRERGEDDGAGAAFRRALQVCPASIAPAAALFELLSARKQYDELLKVLTAAAQACTEPEPMAEHWICVAKILADQQEDVPAAIAALRRLEAAHIKNLPATLELAELYLRDRQYQHAVEQLTLAQARGPSPSQAMSIHLRLAEIFHEKLSKNIEATKELRAVLSQEPDHLAALRRLLVIQMKEKSPDAQKTAQHLADVSEGAFRAGALVALGNLLKAEGKLADAIQPFATAVSLVGVEPPDASEALTEILKKEGDGSEGWAGYQKALASFAETCPVGDHFARVYLEWGRVVADRQKDLPRAIAILESGLKKTPESAALRTELVARLVKANRHAEALPEVWELLVREPLLPQTWADLVHIDEALGHNAEAHLATGCLVLLGQGSELQRAAWRSRVPAPAMVPAGAFSQELLSQTLPKGTSLDGIALLFQLSSLLSKVFPPDLKALGIKASQKVAAGGAHPSRPLLDRICRAFGGLEVDLYSASAVSRMAVVFTDPVGIVIPDPFGDLPEATQACHLGRLVAQIARGTHAVEALTLEQLEVLLAAAVGLVDSRPPQKDLSADQVDDVGRRLQKALPWLSKGRIEDAVKRFAVAPDLDVGRFRSQLQISAWRAGLIVADDLSALAHLTEGGSALAGLAPDSVEPLLSDLLPYWASKKAVDLRRALGIL